MSQRLVAAAPFSPTSVGRAKTEQGIAQGILLNGSLESEGLTLPVPACGEGLGHQPFQGQTGRLASIQDGFLDVRREERQTAEPPLIFRDRSPRTRTDKVMLADQQSRGPQSVRQHRIELPLFLSRSSLCRGQPCATTAELGPDQQGQSHGGGIRLLGLDAFIRSEPSADDCQVMFNIAA